jgi:hypothetical protein
MTLTDLNPIKNVWGLLKDRVWEEAHNLETEGDFIAFIKCTFMLDPMIEKAI